MIIWLTANSTPRSLVSQLVPKIHLILIINHICNKAFIVSYLVISYLDTLFRNILLEQHFFCNFLLGPVEKPQVNLIQQVVHKVLLKTEATVGINEIKFFLFKFKI